MPQLDLRPLFLSPSSQPAQRTTISPSDDLVSETSHPQPPTVRIRLTGAQLTNIAFVIAACLGALVSAVYLFKGSEVFQEVAAWPRELFYGRPSPIPQTSMSTPESPQPISSDQSSIQGRESGDPFSSTRKLLNLEPLASSRSLANGGAAATSFAAPSTLNGLNTPPPAGDALSRALMGAGPDANAVSSAVNSAAAIAKADQAVSAQTKAIGANTAGVANSATKSAAHSVRRVSSVSTARRSAKTQAQPHKVSAGQKSVLSSGSKVQTQTLRSTISSPNQNSSSAVMQSTAGLRSFGGIGNSAGAASAAGIGLGGGHGLGHVGGR